MGKTLNECYQILGLDSSASDVEVRTAYKQLALKCHPDKNPDDPEATIKFQELGCAYKRITSGVEEDKDWCDEDEFTFEDILNFYRYIFRQELMTFHQQQRGRHGRVVVHNDHPDKNFVEEHFEKQNPEYSGKPFTDEEMAKFTAFASLDEQKEANKRKFCPDGKKQRSTKQGQTACKPKSKSNKQLRAEHWKRQQELSKVATEIEKKREQELEKETLKANSQNKEVKEESKVTYLEEDHNTASSLWKGKENVEEKQGNVKTKKRKQKKNRRQMKKEEQLEGRGAKPREFGQFSSETETTVNPGSTKSFPKGHVLPGDCSQPARVPTARTKTPVQGSCTTGSQKQEDHSQRSVNCNTTRVQNQWTKPQSTSPNIWHKRQQQHEFLSELQPVNETEEQQQLKIAIEMSKKQAEIEASQRKVHLLESELDGIGHTYRSCSEATSLPMGETFCDARIGKEAKTSRSTSEKAHNNSYPRVTVNIGDIERKTRAFSGDDIMGVQQRVTEVKIPMKTVRAFEEDQKPGHSDQPSQRRRRKKSCVYGRDCCLGNKCKFSHPKQTQNTKAPSTRGPGGSQNTRGGATKEYEKFSSQKGPVNTCSVHVTTVDGSNGSCSEPWLSEKNLNEGIFSLEDKYGLDRFSVHQDCRDQYATGDARESELKPYDHPQSEEGSFYYKLGKCDEVSKAQVSSTESAEEVQVRIQDHHQLKQGDSQFKLVECEDSGMHVSSGPVEGEQSTEDAKEPCLNVQDPHHLKQAASKYKSVKCGEDSNTRVNSGPVEREKSTSDASLMPSNYWTEEQEAERQCCSASSVKSEGSINEANQFVNPKLDPAHMSTSGAWLAGCVPPNILPQATINHTGSMENISSVPAFPSLPFCMGMPMVNPYMPVPVQVQSTLNPSQQGLVQPETMRQAQGPTNARHDQHSNFLSSESLCPNISVESGKNDFVPSFLCHNTPVTTSQPSNTSLINAVDQRCKEASGQFSLGATSTASCAPAMGPVPYVQRDFYLGSVQMNSFPLPPLPPLMHFVMPGVYSGNGVNATGFPVGMAPVAQHTYPYVPHASEYEVQKTAYAHSLGTMKAKAATRSGDESKEGYLGNGGNVSTVTVGETPGAQKILQQNVPQASECNVQKGSSVFSQDRVKAEPGSPRNEEKVQVEEMLKRNKDQKSEGKLRRPMTVPKVMQKLLER